VKRDAGRRRLRRVAWLGALLSLIVVGYLVTRSRLLDLDHVDIVGLAHTDEAVVRAAGGLHPGEPMTDLDIDRARSAIAALPWVDTVDVARHWPGTVTVKVTERRAVAALEVDASSWLVLDATGRVLETRSTRPDDLAVLSGVGAQAVPGETVPAALPGLALAGYITPDLRAWFVDVVTNPDGTLEADLQSHIRVSFGSQAHLSDKMIGLATVLTRVDLKDLDHIDLQVPNSPVLTRRTTSA
jgi:cell division protein FtsQ